MNLSEIVQIWRKLSNYSIFRNKHTDIFFSIEKKLKLTSLPRFSEKINEIILWKIVTEREVQITVRDVTTGKCYLRPLGWWAKSAPLGCNRVKVSGNLKRSCI